MNGPSSAGSGLPVRERAEVLLRGRIFDLVFAELTLPSGVEQELWIVEHPGAVAIAPVTEAGELVLVRQYRHAAREVLVEIPAGRLERGEARFEAARRELAEETGTRARHWRELAAFLPAPGFCSERIVLFEARGLEAIADRDAPRPDADEDLEVLRLPPEQGARRSRATRDVARRGAHCFSVADLLGPEVFAWREDSRTRKTHRGGAEVAEERGGRGRKGSGLRGCSEGRRSGGLLPPPRGSASSASSAAPRCVWVSASRTGPTTSGRRAG